MDLYILSLIFLCINGISECTGNDDVIKKTYRVDAVKIHLKPPGNITVFSITNTSIFITWQAPTVYPIHDMNATDMDFYDNDTSTTLSPDNKNVTIITTSPANTNTDQKLNATEKADNSSNTTSIRQRPLCMPQGFFMSVRHDATNNTNSSEEIHVSFVGNSSQPVNETNDNLTVPFDQACVERYIVHYINNKTGENFTMFVEPFLDDEDITEANITGLEVNTAYILYVSAQYVSGHILSSERLIVKTKSEECHCNLIGTVREKGVKGPIVCEKTNKHQWCPCKPGYAGVFCELCAPGSYRTGPQFECHRCPCNPESTKACYYKQGYLFCDCKERYNGTMCQSCANGFYRYQRQCIPCECHGNTDPRSPQICNSIIGYCNNCIHNTTGFHCERCLEGYVGDPVHKKNCILKSEAEAGGLPKGVIAGICISVILTLSGIVGFIVYRRWRIFPPKKPFWTVELKEDHDSVNFSAVPEHDYQNIDSAGVDDLHFYENHGGKGSGKNVSRYSPLTEDI